MKNSINTQCHTALQELLTATKANCKDCNICIRECAFLRKYGTPKEIAGRFDAAEPATLNCAFECSLCGLCSTVCPKQIDPNSLFLEMRREAVDHGLGNLVDHKPLLSYERIGTFRHFIFYGLPSKCKTVFFKGCALSETWREAVRKVFGGLRDGEPVQRVVREQISRQVLTIEEMPHSGRITLCCGLGGRANLSASDLAGQGETG
jgi:Fe-S oxidoreductase